MGFTMNMAGKLIVTGKLYLEIRYGLAADAQS